MKGRLDDLRLTGLGFGKVWDCIALKLVDRSIVGFAVAILKMCRRPCSTICSESTCSSSTSSHGEGSLEVAAYSPGFDDGFGIDFGVGFAAKVTGRGIRGIRFTCGFAHTL